jgi:AcrR family transcriptional regulator
MERQRLRPSLREEQKELTRERVLDAAVAVAAEKPFLDMTMDDIAKAAGVTRATVYAHFGTGKGAITDALVQRVYAAADEAYGELAAVDRWTRAVIRTWLSGLTTRWRELIPTVRVITTPGAMLARVNSPAGRAERYVAAHERYVELLAGNPRRWQGVPAAEARQRSLMAVLQVESFLTMWLSGALPVRTRDPLLLLADAVCHLLGPALRD